MAKRSLEVIDDDVIECCRPLQENVMTEKEAHDLALLFGALADPVRLRLLSLIAASDETCSCNLEGPLGRSQPTISHHTRVLAEVGLIKGEKRGRWTYWRAVPERAGAAARVLG